VVRNRTRLTLIFAVGVLTLAPNRAPAGGEFSVGGYVKNFSVVDVLPEYQRTLLGWPDAPAGTVSNRLRLNAHYEAAGPWSVHVSYEVLPRFQDPRLVQGPDILFGLEPLIYRVDDLDTRFYPRPGNEVANFAIFQNLDRLYLSLRAPLFDLFLGRQAIAWGAARVINPTDVITPFLYTALDTEDRIGVDAIRVRVPVGSLSEIDAGWIAGRDLRPENSAFFLRSRLYAAGSDISLVGAAFREHMMFGFDLARGIGGAGFWFEAAGVWMQVFDGNPATSGPDYLRLSTGVDYNFPGDIYGFVEYHFNGAGSSDPADYVSTLGTSPYQDASVYLLGKHYVVPGFTAQITPLWTLTASVLLNIPDPSLLFSPIVEYNIAEDIYLQGGAYLGAGKPASLELGFPPRLEFHSEFGSYSDFYFFSFRFYF
jgi:hypothetical protein